MNLNSDNGKRIICTLDESFDTDDRPFADYIEDMLTDTALDELDELFGYLDSDLVNKELGVFLDHNFISQDVSMVQDMEAHRVFIQVFCLEILKKSSGNDYIFKQQFDYFGRSVFWYDAVGYDYKYIVIDSFDLMTKDPFLERLSYLTSSYVGRYGRTFPGRLVEKPYVHIGSVKRQRQVGYDCLEKGGVSAWILNG